MSLGLSNVEMMLLLKYELRRLLKGNIIKLSVGLLCLLMMISCLQLLNLEKEYMQTRSEYFLRQHRLHRNNIVLYEDYFKLNPDDVKTKQVLEFHEKQAKQSNALNKFYLSDKTKDYVYMSTILGSFYKNYDEAYEMGVITEEFIKERRLDLEFIRSEIDRAQYYQDQGIEPELNPYRFNAVNFMRFVLDSEWLFLTILLVVLIASEVFNREKGEGSYKVLYSMHYNRHQIYLSKIICACLMSSALVIIVTGSALLIGLVIGGLGQLSYPVLTYTHLFELFKSSRWELMVLNQVSLLLLMFTLAMVVAWFAVLLVAFLSVVFKGELSSFSTTVIMLLFTYAVYRFSGNTKELLMLNPFSYLFAFDIARSAHMTSYVAALVNTLVLTLLMGCFSTYWFSVKDFS